MINIVALAASALSTINAGRYKNKQEETPQREIYKPTIEKGSKFTPYSLKWQERIWKGLK
jgi:hypothetical protein